MEKVLENLNTLNRSLQGVVALGKEFDSISKLWESFYTDVTRIEVPEEDAEAHGSKTD